MIDYENWQGYSGWGEWVPRFPIETNPNDVTKLKLSAKSFMQPTQEIQGLLQAIAYKDGFAATLKKSAELNQNKKVTSLIRSTGVKSEFDTRLSPDGIRIVFQPMSTEACFSITLSLCW